MSKKTFWQDFKHGLRGDSSRIRQEGNATTVESEMKEDDMNQHTKQESSRHVRAEAEAALNKVFKEATKPEYPEEIAIRCYIAGREMDKEKHRERVAELVESLDIVTAAFETIAMACKKARALVAKAEKSKRNASLDVRDDGVESAKISENERLTQDMIAKREGA